MKRQERTENLKLIYTIFCDDVRLEVGNKLSLMGTFQNIVAQPQQIPLTLLKFAVVNHWQGEGEYLAEVRILSPDRQRTIVISQPTRFEILPGGFADNISFFINVTFPEPGQYWVQTLINAEVFDEQPLGVVIAQAQTSVADATDSIN
jgi:hypothetical protein